VAQIKDMLNKYMNGGNKYKNRGKNKKGTKQKKKVRKKETINQTGRIINILENK
jgi:hypothetical protein